jgi:hypothetical protein
VKKVSFATQPVQLRSYKWVWTEKNEWNPQQSAGPVYQFSLSLHTLKYLVRMFEAPDSTQRQVLVGKCFTVCFQIITFDFSANNASHNTLWPNIQFYLNQCPCIGCSQTDKQSTQLKPIMSVRTAGF